MRRLPKVAGRAGVAWSGKVYFLFISGVVIDKSFLVLAHSPFEFVDKAIDCGVHIFFSVVAVDSATVNAGGCFSLMPQLFDGQDTLDVRHDVKVSGNFLYFCADVVSHGFSYLDMMA